MQLIARDREKVLLTKCQQDRKSHFLVIYGRRRVGKTFLIRQHFNNEFDFYATGLADGDTSTQLTNFAFALSKSCGSDIAEIPQNWMQAFHSLIQYLESSSSKKKTIFIDELPWMDTPRSKFLSALEYFWNSWASARNDILLIACGSAASWMLNKVINNKRGLYNRVTRRIHLSPFTLHEVEQFLESRDFIANRYQILQLYMAVGGIPYYLDQLDKNLSIAQNIQNLFFIDNAPLRHEFQILLKSLFDNSEAHKQIIQALTKKKTGLTRNEILSNINTADGGGLTRTLSELMASDFIRKYKKYGNKSRDAVYQLTDPFTLFHHRFLQNYDNETNYWLNLIHTPAVLVWQGNAFEIVGLLHVEQIKIALGISGVQTSTFSWWGKHAQIDLVIDRKDQVINLVELKFSLDEYTINKDYDSKLRIKLNEFRKETQTKKALWTTMLTTYGLKKNKYSGNVQKVLTMDDLFKTR